MYPAIEFCKLDGNEKIIASDGSKISSVVEFWRWAYSDIMGNAERGVFAEYLVACALGVQDSVRISWDKYDLKTKEGIAVEVKTSGYLQTWEQKELSKIVFSINPTFGWDSEKNTYDLVQKRQADVYVFCVHKHKDKSTADPLDLSQWEFYVMPTIVLNEKFGDRKTASLNGLINAGAEVCEFENINNKIKEVVGNDI
ncbi:MAG: hypothetical protein E7228_04365 [Clostridiales bacterium]|nr:hypothetical protein [Clostridiales bacterium]